MAWEKHGDRTYFYRSVRCDGQVKKVYYGGGPAGQLAAQVEALRRAERQAEENIRRTARDQLDAAVALTRDLARWCEFLAAGTLLAAGFHRPNRHSWRIWRHGCKALRTALRAAP
jgi:hypothetical protein